MFSSITCKGPKEYYQAGRISYLPHNVYTNMPFNVEMLHLLAMEVMGDWWWGGLAGQLLVALFGPAAAILIGGSRSAVRVAPRGVDRGARLSVDAVDLPAGGDCLRRGPALLLSCGPDLGGARGQGGSRWPVAAGLGIAGAPGRLRDGLQIHGFGVGGHSVRAALRSWTPGGRGLRRLVGCYVLGWAVVMAPWLGKNVLDTRNPVYPLECRIFPSPEWDAGREVKWQAVHGPRPIDIGELKSSMADVWHGRELQPDSFRAVRQFWSSVVDVAGRSDWQSPLYLALAPLSLLRPGSRRAGACALVVRGIPVLDVVVRNAPARSILAADASGAGDSCRPRRGLDSHAKLVGRPGIVMTIGLFTNLTYISTALAGFNEWTGDLVFLRHDIPRRWNAAMARLDTELPPDAKPLLVGQAAVFHLDHNVAYNTVFNPETIEQLAKGKTADEFRRGLEERNLTHVYVDWKEISRHREPGDTASPTLSFRPDLPAGSPRVCWRPAKLMGPDQELYEVRPAGRSRPTGPSSLD